MLDAVCTYMDYFTLLKIPNIHVAGTLVLFHWVVINLEAHLIVVIDEWQKL